MLHLPPELAGARVNQHVAILRPRKGILDSRFLAYALVSDSNKRLLLSLARAGATREALTKGGLERFEVACPAYPVQKRIISILGAYDDLIEVNRRRIAVLEEMARRLFEEWFVRFRFPGHEGQKIVETPDGLMPEGWQRRDLEEMLVLHRGFDLPATARTAGPFPVLAATGVHGMHDETKGERPCRRNRSVGTLGTVLLVQGDCWPLNTTLYVSEFRRASPAFALFLLRHLDLKSHGGGAAVPTLNRNHVHRLSVPCPPPELVELFENQRDGGTSGNTGR